MEHFVCTPVVPDLGQVVYSHKDHKPHVGSGLLCVCGPLLPCSAQDLFCIAVCFFDDQANQAVVEEQREKTKWVVRKGYSWSSLLRA